MKTDSKIRPVIPSDISALKEVIETNDLFPSDLLYDMIANYFNNENGNDFWFTYDDHKPIAIAYVAPEQMTKGTWNLYLIAVHPDYQGKGIGTAMMEYIEKMLATRGERILIVETSALDPFEQTRMFYRQCGFEEEARIREFYQAGEDKIIFRKSLRENT